MKKTLLVLCIGVISAGFMRGQCVSTCSNYAMSPITFTTFPSAGTNPIGQFSPNTDDGVTPLIPIGFSFNFYCTTYTDVWICTNGFIQFNNGVPAISTGFADPTQMFPNATNPNAMVALNMNDLDPGSGGTITYTTIGTSPNQMFIVTYSNVPVYNYPTSLHTGQIVLYETSNIIEIYTDNVINNGTTAGTQGIENASGTLGVAVPGRNNVIWSASNSAYQFAPYTPAPPSAITGPTTICEGTQNSYAAVPMVGASSYSWSFPSGWNGSSTTTAVTALSGASGNVSVTATYTCGTSAATQLYVNTIAAPVVGFTSVNPPVLCSGYTFTVVPNGATSYTLNPGNNTTSGSTPFVITGNTTTTYSLSGTDASNCQSFNTSTTTIVVNPSPTVTVNSGTICSGQTFTMTPTGGDSYNYSNGFSTVGPTTPGVYSYSVTGMALNGCTSVTPAISSLTVSPNPTISITASRPNICKGETTVLTASVASTYSWINGPTTNTYAVNPTATTAYTVIGTTAEGCSKSKNMVINVYACVGIEEAGASGAGVSVYPNPSAGLLNLRFEVLHENTHVDVYDATGRLIFSRQAVNAELQLDLSAYAQGLYYLSIKNGDATEIVKIVKE